MHCPNCGTRNADTYKYCMKCGHKLPSSTPETEKVHMTDTERAMPKPIPVPDTAAQDQREAPFFSPDRPSKPLDQPRLTTGHATRVDIPFDTSGLAGLNIWGPFAGYGTRRRHVGWLMNGQGQRSPDLIETVETKFQERQVPGATLSRPVLVARGVLVERRPYFMLQRGLATLALYISQFGRDLFVSMASYLKPPISNFRVAVLSIMILFGLYIVFGYPISLANSLESSFGGLSLFGSSGPDVGGFFTLLCLIGPLGGINNLALFLFFCFGLYKWLKEKDFWAGLRVPPNEFNEDDLMAMEKAVEETVRQSLTDLKLNPDELKLASVGQGGQLF